MGKQSTNGHEPTKRPRELLTEDFFCTWSGNSRAVTSSQHSLSTGWLRTNSVLTQVHCQSTRMTSVLAWMFAATGRAQYPMRLLTLSKSATAASSDSAATFSGSFSRCPTDYFVTVDDDDDKLRLQLWQDFGSYASPENLDWRVHVRTDRNNEAGGPSLYHVPGSVREAYERFDATDTKC